MLAMNDPATLSAAPPKRRRFSFSLRTLLIVTTLIVPPLSWFAYEFRRASVTEAAIHDLSLTDFKVDHRGDLLLRHWFGNFFMARIHGGRAQVDTDAKLATAAGLGISTMSIRDVSPAAMRNL